MNRALFLALLILVVSAPPSHSDCDCPPLPPPSGNEDVVVVGSVAALQDAISAAGGQPTTIYLEEGTYDVSSAGGINVFHPNITIRSLTGQRDDVVFVGAGMGASGTAHGIYVNESNITVADVTIRDIPNHAVFVAPANEPENLLFHNLRCVDTGEQIFKASGIELPKRNGVIQCSVFEYTTTLDQGDYTNGIDLLNCHDWIIRDNLIRNVQAAPGSGLAGPAILIWHDSSGTIIERNRIIDCDMGIFFGNSSESGVNHIDGVIKNNFVKGYDGSDAGIGLVRSVGAVVVNNSVYSTGSLPWSIEVRYPECANCTVMNNLVDQVILMRSGATATLITNMEYAPATVFVDAAAGDLHLAADDVAPVNVGTATSFRTVDIDCEGISDDQPDIGADEYRSPSGVGDPGPRIPSGLQLRVFGNPSGPGVQIFCQLLTSDPAKLWVFDANGRCVHRRSLDQLPPGSHVFEWNARDLRDHPVPSGPYFFELQAGTRSARCRAVVVR